MGQHGGGWWVCFVCESATWLYASPKGCPGVPRSRALVKEIARPTLVLSSPSSPSPLSHLSLRNRHSHPSSSCTALRHPSSSVLLRRHSFTRVSSRLLLLPPPPTTDRSLADSPTQGRRRTRVERHEGSTTIAASSRPPVGEGPRAARPPSDPASTAPRAPPAGPTRTAKTPALDLPDPRRPPASARTPVTHARPVYPRPQPPPPPPNAAVAQRRMTEPTVSRVTPLASAMCTRTAPASETRTAHATAHVIAIAIAIAPRSLERAAPCPVRTQSLPRRAARG